MRIILISKLFFLLSISQTQAQFPETAKITDFKKPDTIYHHFTDGWQMIEIDHLEVLALRNKAIQEEYSMRSQAPFFPTPIGNEFYFRDRSGKIKKAFNSPHSIDTLNKIFANVPLDIKSFPLPKKPYDEKSYWENPFNFDSYIKVSNQVVPHTGFRYDENEIHPYSLLFGLIDHKGDIVVPIQYQFLSSTDNDLLLARKQQKYGIMDYAQNAVVPFIYDAYHANHSDKVIAWYFGNGRKYQLIYNLSDRSQYPLDNYDRIHDHYRHYGYYLVEKNGLYGLVTLQGKIVLPPDYTRIYNVNTAECTTKRCALVQDAKLGKVQVALNE